MNRVRCFWLEPTGRAQVSLRRYRSSSDPESACPGPMGYCNASVVIGECEYTERAVSVTEEMKLEPQWPTVCEGCGKEFNSTDQWQWNEYQLYKRSDTGELIGLREAPAGAMWDAHWFKRFPDFKKRPDGIMLVVKTPGGDWCVDGPSSNGNGWERSGTVPDITAQPSILQSKYHGWLRNGWLEEC